MEIAKLAGVSKSTVSRVINHSAGVKPDVERAVSEAIKKLGYEPTALRRGPKPPSRRGVRTGNILMLVLGFSASELYSLPVFPSLLRGVDLAMRESGMFLVLAGYHPGEPVPPSLSNRQLDGVLVFGVSDALSPTIKARLDGLPIVGLMRGFEDFTPPIDRVLYNNGAIGPLAARYLIERGRQKLAFVNTVPEHPAFAPRGAGFIAAAREGGAPVQELVASRRPEGIANQKNEFTKIVQKLVKEKVDGVFIPNDEQAPLLYQALEESGLVPGQDIEVVSCDNENRFLSALTPRPATFDINLELVGRRGVEQLAWRMSHPNEPPRITILVEPLLVRGKSLIPTTSSQVPATEAS